MRQRITERNKFPIFSVETEYKKLHELFCDRSEFGLLVGPLGDSKARPSLSYNDLLQGWFLDWNLRGTFICIEEMLSALKISEDDFDKDATEDRLMDYIQFIINGACFVADRVKSRKYSIYQTSDSIFKAIVENSRNILEKLGAELIQDDGELCVILKNDVATAITEQNPDLERSITEYLKIDNHGDLERKGEILCTLAKRLEPHEKAFRSTELNQLCSDTTMLMDKIARHYQNPNDKIQAKFFELSDDELEKWYDRTFQLFLTCMAAVPYLEYKNEIKRIKDV